MKYIITEEQSIVIRVRRSIDQDYDLIKESVVEGMEMYLCDYDTLNDFYEFICRGSAMTYLFFYFDNQYQEGYQKMEDYMTDFIKENFGEMIVKYWDDNRDDC